MNALSVDGPEESARSGSSASGLSMPGETPAGSPIVGAVRFASRVASHLTMHRAVLLALLVLAVCAFAVSVADDEFVSRPDELGYSLLISLAVSGLVTYVCAAVIRVPPGADSWAITGLIIFFLMPGVTDTASAVSVIIAAGSASLSKYVIVWRRRLLLNPAVAGAIVSYAVAYPGVSIGGVPLSSPTWWVAAEPLFWPMLIVAVVLVTLLREWWMVAVFFAATLVTVGVLEAVKGGQDLHYTLVSVPTIFLAAIMLPEPLTSPTTRVHRAVYAVIVAVLANWQQSFDITDAYTLEFVPQIALGVGCIYACAVRMLSRGGGRAVLGATTEPIAASSYRLRVDAGTTLGYRPGQWAMLSAPRWSAPLWHRTRRVFSYADAPGSTASEFGFTTATAVSKRSSFKAGLVDGTTDTLYLDATGGDFVLPRRPGGHRRILFASGIGITPFRAMLRSVSADPAADLSWLTVVHVIRSERAAVYDDDLAGVVAAGARVEVIIDPVLADGITDTSTVAEIVGSGSAAHYYFSGNPAFVRRTARAVRRVDSATWWQPWRVHTDAFLGY